MKIGIIGLPQTGKKTLFQTLTGSELREQSGPPKPLPGIAERGETCGAVSGPLMAMGLIYGRSMHQLDNWDLYQQSLVPAGDFCARFEEAFGTTLCHEVQQGKFGRCYRLTDPGELQEFQNDGATEKCSEVVRQAVRLAAGIILDDPALS